MSRFRLIMLCPYFGPLPAWFHLFKLSCEKNADVDFLFFTDQDMGPLAPNMKVQTMSFLEFRAVLSKRLDLELTWTRVYKIADLKPALGLVFNEHLGGYTHWGFMDMDILLGRITTVLDEEAQGYDTISSHSAYFAGHFSVFSTHPVIVRLFTAVKQWRAAFQDSRHHFFDEECMGKLILGDRFMRFFHAPQVKKVITIDGQRFRTLFREQYSTFADAMLWKDGTLRLPGHWEWRDGILTAPFLDGQEMLYVHFMHWLSKDYVRDNQRTWSRLETIVHPGLGPRPSAIHISAQGLAPMPA